MAATAWHEANISITLESLASAFSSSCCSTSHYARKSNCANAASKSKNKPNTAPTPTKKKTKSSNPTLYLTAAEPRYRKPLNANLLGQKSYLSLVDEVLEQELEDVAVDDAVVGVVGVVVGLAVVDCLVALACLLQNRHVFIKIGKTDVHFLYYVNN